MSKKKEAKENSRPDKSLVYGIVGILLVAVFAYTGFVLSRPTSPEAATAQTYPPEVNLEEAVVLRDGGAFVLDVRTPEEWEEYHLPGSTLIPLDELESRLNEIPSDQEILVVCRSGNRSAVGRDILLDAGFEEVTSLAGGLKGWKAAGYPTETGP